MSKSFRRMVAQEDYFDDQESLRAYSYDASGFCAMPEAIVRPKTIDQLRRIILHANQHRIPLIPRGAGTGTRGGAIMEGGVIVDMRNFATLEKLDRQLQTITVGAGVPIGRLNQTLKTYGYYIPMQSQSPIATIGGLAAKNAAGLFSFKYGDMSELVQEVECFDGLGRFSVLKGDSINKAVGKEGTTAIIVKLKIKVAKIEKITLSLIEVDNIDDALNEAKQLEDETLIAIEYCDEKVSELLHIGEKKHLLCIYESDAGNIKDEEKANNILKKREQLSKLLYGEGFTTIEAVTIDENNIESFANYCQKHKLPCYGHLGIGIIYTHLHTIQDRQSFWNSVVAIGGTPAGIEGFGRIAVNYVPEKIKREVRVLKEERDYNEILNPGVLLATKKVTQQKQEFVADSVRHAIFEEENDAFLATRDLRLSNRHVRYLLSKGIASPLLYRIPIYNRSTMDNEILELRAKMVSRGIETAQNKEMIAKIRAGKNAFR